MNGRRLIYGPLRLILLWAVSFSLAGAHSQKKATDLAPVLGSQVARITGVTNRGVVGDDATLVIRVGWAVQRIQDVTPLGFIASVEVEYADGSKNAGSAPVGASATQADIRVLNKGSNSPRKFKATLETRFTVFDSNFATRTADFVLEKANGFASTGSASPAIRPGGDALTISRVRADFNGCSGRDCYTVEWAVGQQRGFTFEQFSVQGDVTYSGGVNTNRTASATVSGSSRSAQLAVDKPKSEFVRIKVSVTIKASATVQQNQRTELAGAF